MTEKTTVFNRHDFMAFFRDDDKLNQLSTDDRVEIFKTILVGSSDINKKLLTNLLVDYGVDHLQVVEVGSD